MNWYVLVLMLMSLNKLSFALRNKTQLAGVVEYNDCIFAEGKDSPNECPRYNTKQSDGETPARALGNVKYPFIVIAPRSTLARSGST